MHFRTGISKSAFAFDEGISCACIVFMNPPVPLGLFVNDGLCAGPSKEACEIEP